MTSTEDRLGAAKSKLIEACRLALDEKLPASIINQIEAVTGKVEAIQNKIRMRGT